MHKNIDNLLTSNEAIAFQSNSTLAKRLVELFQSVHDYRDNLKFKENENEIKIREQKIYRVGKFCQDVIEPKFIKIVKEETGLIVKKFDWTLKPMLVMNAYVTCGFDDWLSVKAITGQVTGLAKPVKVDEAIREVQKTKEQLNLLTGKLNKTSDDQKTLFCSVYLDEQFFFLLNEYIGEEVIKCPTAAETAAVMLHEIGHIISAIELYDRSYHYYNEINTSINTAIKNKDVITLMENLPVVIKSIKDNVDSMEDKETGSKMLTVMLNITEVWHALGISRSNVSYMHPLLVGLIVSIFGAVVIPWIGYLALTALGADLAKFNYDMFKIANEESKLNNIGKTSDVRVTKRNQFLIERLADEYVSRHGMGSADASITAKMEMCCLYISALFRAEHVVTKRQLRFAATISGLYKLFPGSRRFANKKYENGSDRIIRQLQNTVNIFKNPNMNSTVRNMYLAEYEAIVTTIKTLKEFEETRYNKFITVWNNMQLLSAPARLINALSTGNLDKDYELLLNQLDDLISNDLYYQSSKLLQLANRK